MIKNHNTYKIMELFFKYPSKTFQLREISRLTKLGMPSVKIHIKALRKEGFIEKKKGAIYPNYMASKSDRFKVHKRNYTLARLYESGLLDLLDSESTPDAVVLYGSASRGEDIESSDIDLLVIAKEKAVNLEKFEKEFNRKIHIMFENSISSLPKELLNSIINGIVIYGYIRVFE